MFERDQKEDRKPEIKARIDLDCLKITITSLRLPEIRKIEVKTTSSLGGETIRNKTRQIDFQLRLEIDRSSDMAILKSLGINHKPKENVLLVLTLDDEELLRMTVTSKYEGMATGTRDVRVNERYISAGQQTAYGPKDSPGYWEYHTVQEPYEYKVMKSEKIEDREVENEEFKELYLGILNSDDSEIKESLLSFLHKKFPRYSEISQNWIRSRMEEKIKIVQAELTEQQAIFSALQLPVITG